MKKKIARRKSSTKSRVASEDFKGKNLTRFGGAGLIRRFFEKFNVRKHLDTVTVKDRRKSPYSPGAMCESIVHALMLGIYRPSHMMELVADKVFQQIVGFTGFPVQSTISRFFKRVDSSTGEQVRGVRDGLLTKVRQGFRNLKTVTLDVDSHVKTVYGKQEGAAKGYNPKKRGRKSFHPLLCFIGETRDVLGGRLRAGNASDDTDAIAFVKEMVQKLPQWVRIRLRADSGFFSAEFIRWLKDQSILFYIVVPQWIHIQRHILKVKSWREISPGISVGHFFLSLGGKDRVRAVVVRQAVAEGEEPRKQLKLFGQQGIRYDYQVIATSSHAAGEHVWRCYNERACCENMIKEGVRGFGLDNNVCHSFAGAQLHFELVLLAYNLMNALKESALDQSKHKETARTLRRKYLRIPGKLVRSARSTRIHLVEWWPYREPFERAVAALD